ncbi:MAG: extracellular solute-binding protein [Oscillospiraceae bacterium]|nr:extracellular solute-binding protein [Oscillospiraceae bacterium]
MKNKIIFFILIALILAPAVFFSCGESAPPHPSGNDAQSPGAESDGAEEIQNTSEEKILPELPEADYGGHIFNILTFGVTGSYQWENVDLTSEGESGEVIGDAVYKRNIAIEERYNIKVREIHLYDGNFGSSLKKEIGAGTNEYDLISPRLIDSASYIQSGYFLNLFKAPNLDLSKPWYNRQGIAEMSIDHKLFILLSDTLLSGNDATSIIVFNKKIIRDYGLEDPYALVRSGKWTIDKLYEMAKTTAKDLNGDGVMTPDADLYGYITWNDAMVSFLHAGGQRLIGKDENDLPVLMFNDEKVYDVMEKTMDLMYDENVTGNLQKALFSKYPDASFENIFSADRAAFGWCRLYMIPQLRAMETDFGIVPIPKIYESIEGYPSIVNVHHACALSIPVTTADMDRTTVIMEALAAESKYTLSPAYYEISLKTKHSRDDESAEMLDLILANRVIDIGDVYNFADFGNQFYQLAANNNRNLRSFYEKFESKVNNEINKLIAKFENLD